MTATQTDDSSDDVGMTRRQLFRRGATVGAAIAAGGTASGIASASVGGLVMTPTSPKLTGLLFAEAVDRNVNNEDPTRDKITLHNQATGARAWWDAVVDMIRDSRLQDASMTANVEARVAIADAWEAGKTQSEARDAALTAIREFFDVPATNATETFASALAEIGYAARAAKADGSIDDRFISLTIPDSGYSDSANTSIDTANTHIWPGSEAEMVKNVIDLPSGATAEVYAPDVKQAWDSGDELIFSLEDVQDGYDATNEEIVLTTADGETATFQGITNVQNVPDTDLQSETLIVFEAWADIMDEIATMSSNVAANYDTTLVGKIYDALDAGDISPSDVRGVEGLAEFLSGTSDATDSRYQMALMTQLGLERADLSDVASMTATYTGYTDEKIDRASDGSINSVTLSGQVSDKTMEGHLFADLGDQTSLSAGESYAAGGLVFTSSGGDVTAIDAGSQSRLWTYSTGDSVNHMVASPSGETVYIATNSSYEVHAVNTADGTQKWVYTGFANYVNGVDAGPDGTVYAGSNGGGVHAIDPADGTQIWTNGTSNQVRCVAISPDGSTVYSGAGSTVYSYAASDGSENWSYTGHSDTVSAIGVSPGSSTVYSGTWGNPVHAINASDGSQKWTYSQHSNTVNGIAIGPDGSVFSASDDNSVHAINPDGTQNWTYTGHSDSVEAVSVAPGGHTVFSASADTETHGIYTSDGSQRWTYARSATVAAVAAWRVDADVSGTVQRATFFDAPSGTEEQLVNGVVTIDSMTDKDGNSVDGSVSWDRPEHDSTDMEEYRTYVETVTEEQEDAIAEEESSGGVPSVSLSDGNLGILLLGGAAVLGYLGLKDRQ